MSKKKGRKSAYENIILPNIEKIQEMISNGALDKDIYKVLGISKSTWFKFKSENKEFTDFIKNGRMPLVAEIENAMFKSATGYTIEIKKGMKVKNIEYDNGKKISEYEDVKEYTEELHIPPNPSSGKFLLMNWGKGNYTNDPMALELKREEIERKKQESDDW